MVNAFEGLRWQEAKAMGRWTLAIQPHATTHKSSRPSDLKLTLVKWYSILRSLHCEETDQLIQQDYALNKLVSMVMITCFLRAFNPLFFYTLFLLLTHTFKQATKHFSCEQSGMDKRTSFFKTLMFSRKKDKTHYYHYENGRLPPTYLTQPLLQKYTCCLVSVWICFPQYAHTFMSHKWIQMPQVVDTHAGAI